MTVLIKAKKHFALSYTILYSSQINTEQLKSGLECIARS